MRMVCGFDVVLAAPLAPAATVAYADRSSPDRLGWREIVTTGSGVTLARDEAATCARPARRTA